MKTDKEIIDEIVELVDENSSYYVSKDNIITIIRDIINERDEFYLRLEGIENNLHGYDRL
jgi:hypothetical protein